MKVSSWVITTHVESLQYHKSINADARAGEGFRSWRAKHHKLANQHSTQIRCGNKKSDAFETNTGVPQGDCVSANITNDHRYAMIHQWRDQPKHAICRRYESYLVWYEEYRIRKQNATIKIDFMGSHYEWRKNGRILH